MDLLKACQINKIKMTRIPVGAEWETTQSVIALPIE